MTVLRIVATGSYCNEVSGAPPALKGLAREASGGEVRRFGRFVQLALIGAGRCVNGQRLPASTATYLSSCRGDLEVTLEVLEQLYEHGQSPKPLSFINTVSNSACFHVAKSFGARGRSQFVTSRHAPLESALRLAALDLSHGGVTAALVGSVEICTAPLPAHRARIGVGADTAVGEGSHWFLLAAGDEPGTSLGVLRSVRSFADETDLRQHLRERRFDPNDTALAAGQSLDPDAWGRLSEASGVRRVFAYRRGLPWYDSQTGYGIHQFLVAPVARTLVHLDGDPSGRFTLMEIEAAAPNPPAAAAPRRSLRDRRSER